MKHILLPTDFSDNSWNAITYAISLFKEEVCTFYFLNTYTPVVYRVDSIMGSTSQLGLADALRQTSLNGLNQINDKLSETFGANPKHAYKMLSRFNYLVSGIKEFLSKNETDLVVMGTQGATGAKEVLFGSNTVQVFNDIKCPVMAIPEGCEYEKPSEILFPTDLQVDFNSFQLDILKHIASTNQSKVHGLHVSMGAELTRQQKENKAELETQFSDTTFVFHHYKSMPVTAAIDKFQTSAKLNVLAMINNKRSFFENIFFKSTINQLGFHIHLPFLVIPAKD